MTKQRGSRDKRQQQAGQAPLVVVLDPAHHPYIYAYFPQHRPGYPDNGQVVPHGAGWTYPSDPGYYGAGQATNWNFQGYNYPFAYDMGTQWVGVSSTTPMQLASPYPTTPAAQQQLTSCFTYPITGIQGPAENSSYLKLCAPSPGIQ